MKAIGQKGFTIVELLIGIIAASILALTAGTMLANVYKGWVRSVALADMEREAAVAIHAIDLAVRGASNAVPNEVGQDKLKIVIPSNGIVRAFTVRIRSTPEGERRDLLYNSNGSSGGFAVITNRLDYFYASPPTAKVVRVTMTLKGINNNNVDTEVRMGVTNMCILMRN